MQIEKNRVVTIHYTLKNEGGEVIDSSEGRDPLSYIHGTGSIIPGLEKALEGKAAGEELNVTVPSKSAYGDRQEELVQQVPRDRFQIEGDLEPGMQFRSSTPEGSQVFTITAIEGEEVTVDGNHPLAGEDLEFDVQVEEVREATAEELDHGHVHGPDGHHH